MDYSLEQLIPIVKGLSEKYTLKESTSITYELADQLMGAVVYCIEENFIDSTNRNEILGFLDVETAYKKGYELVLKKATKSKKIYEHLILKFESYGNMCYYDTIVEGIPKFFIHYDSKFNPQNHILTLDYPILKPLEDFCGVDIIYKYIIYIYLEQLFLSAFAKNYIINILNNYSNGYKLLCINICSVVMRNLICHIILNKDLKDLKFNDKEILYIKNFVQNNTKDELQTKLSDILKMLIDKKYNKNKSLFNYLKEDIKDFTTELINATNNDCIATLFTLQFKRAIN